MKWSLQRVLVVLLVPLHPVAWMKETKHREIQEVSGVWQGNKEWRLGRGSLSNGDVSQWRQWGRTGFLVSTKQWRFHNKSMDMRGLFLDRFLQPHDFTLRSKRQENCDIMEGYGVHYWDHSRTTSIKELFLCCVCESRLLCQHKTFLLMQMFFSFFYKDTSALLVVLEVQCLWLQHLPRGGRGQHRWEAVSDRDTTPCMYL